MTDLIAAHLEHIQAAGLADTTITDRGELLRRVDADLPYGLEQATVEELRTWLAGPSCRPSCRHRRRATGSCWGAQTKATYYGHLRGFFRWACNPLDPILDYDPTAALTRPRVPRGTPRPVTNDQLAATLAKAVDPWRRYVLLAAYAGLRCCEIVTIRREDINEERIVVRGKGGAVDTVPTHPEIWRSVRDLPPGPIARTRTGRPMSATYLSHRASIYLARLGVGEAVTMHMYRHWLGTESLRANGGNLRITQQLLRHSSVATTAVYTQVADEERRAVIHALPTLAAAA